MGCGPPDLRAGEIVVATAQMLWWRDFQSSRKRRAFLSRSDRKDNESEKVDREIEILCRRVSPTTLLLDLVRGDRAISLGVAPRLVHEWRRLQKVYTAQPVSGNCVSAAR